MSTRNKWIVGLALAALIAAVVKGSFWVSTLPGNSKNSVASRREDRRVDPASVPFEGGQQFSFEVPQAHGLSRSCQNKFAVGGEP